MSEQNLGRRHRQVADFVRGLEAEDKDKDATLRSVGVTSREMAAAMTLTEATARKYLRAAIAAGELVEVKHKHRLLDFPWPEGVEFKPQRWAQGTVKRGRFYMTEEHQLGPAMRQISFVFTPERLKQVVDAAMEVDGEKALERAHRRVQEERRRAAEQTEQAELFAQHYPVLAELLGVLDKRVREPDESEPAVRLTARVHPQAGFTGRAYIHVSNEQFAELEAILRDGLGAVAEGGQEGSSSE